jgi:hypothetical protein
MSYVFDYPIFVRLKASATETGFFTKKIRFSPQNWKNPVSFMGDAAKLGEGSAVSLAHNNIVGTRHYIDYTFTKKLGLKPRPSRADLI